MQSESEGGGLSIEVGRWRNGAFKKAESGWEFALLSGSKRVVMQADRPPLGKKRQQGNWEGQSHRPAYVVLDVLDKAGKRVALRAHEGTREWVVMMASNGPTADPTSCWWWPVEPGKSKVRYRTEGSCWG